MKFSILALNPSKQKGKKTVAKKRRGKSGTRRRRSYRPAIVRYNPPLPMAYGNPNGRVRRVYTRSRGFLESSGLGGAFKSMLPMSAGALSCKLIQKRFGDGTDEAGNWTWKDYLAGSVGTLIAGFAARHLMRAGQSTAQKVFEGGFLIIFFKMITQELVPMSETATEWLGEGEDSDLFEEDTTYQIGDIAEDESGREYVLGQDGAWRPTGNLKAMPGTVFGDVTKAPGALGDVTKAPGALGAVPASVWADPYCCF